MDTYAKIKKQYDDGTYAYQDYKLSGELVIDDSVNNVTSASLTVITELRHTYRKYADTQIYVDDTLLYSGLIDTATTYWQNGYYHTDITMIGYAINLDDIYITLDYDLDDDDDTTSVAMTLPSFLAQIKSKHDITPYIGFAVSNDLVDYTIDAALYDYVPLSEVLATLCDTYNLYYFVRDDNTIIIRSLYSQSTHSVATFDDDDVLNRKISEIVDHDNLISDVYFSEGYTIVNKTYTFRGNGDMRTFDLPMSLASKPVIAVFLDNESNQNNEWLTQKVGKSDNDSLTINWYYNKMSNTITQNSNDNVLVATDTVKISGQFLKPYRKTISNTIIKTKLNTVSSGHITQRVHICDDITLGLSAMHKKAERITNASASDALNVNVQYDGRANHLRVGDVITLNSDVYGYTNRLFVITAINRTVIDNDYVTNDLTLTATNGTRTKTPREQLKNKIKTKAINRNLASNSGKSITNNSMTSNPIAKDTGQSEYVYRLDVRDSAPIKPVEGQMWLLK